MDFSLTEEQQMMIDAAQRVGGAFGLDYWKELDAQKVFPEAFWQAVCDAGLAGTTLPVEYGGSGLGMLELALVIETLCSSSGGGTVAQLFMNNPIFGGVAVNKFGTAEIKQALLPKLVTGNLRFCMALTEPDAGTNTLNMKTFARQDGDGWRLNGQKIWISGVPNADKMLVIARTQAINEIVRKTDGISMFLIDVEREGLSHTPIDKLGTHTLVSSSVFFDDVYVESEELLGSLHKGWRELLEVLNTERIVTAAGAVGAGALALRLAVEYANKRTIFGETPIAAYQGLQFPLAQAHAEIDCARQMNYKAATLFDQGKPYAQEANVAKLIAAQAATKATERAMQTMGGMGYAKEYHVERLWRDVRLFRFAPISEEMILNFIAVHHLGMPRSY